MYEEISFANSDREEVEQEARELFNHIKRLGVRLDDIDVLDPCGGCRRQGYLVHIGSLPTDEVRVLNSALRELLRPTAPDTEER
ncbi:MULTISPECIES: hypothetical protein [unclassified Streptomyces]|uniref:hypothetical protein n=1 Tax=unclassified Streptomyces TaxID=2593676 RepID=UPI000CD572B1|nr:MULTISPECIES: hypothetical protein [unclassified Streptomyces]